MALVVARLTVAQAATLVNACFALIQLTLGVIFVVVLVHLMPSTNPAAVWTTIAGKLQSSHWPTILRTDSSSSKGADARVRLISLLAALTTFILPIATVVTPLGLSDGKLLRTSYADTPASFVKDTSPFGLAASPRSLHTYGRVCGAFGPLTCPGNDTPNTTTIAQPTVDAFSSTPHGPFNMQFRRYHVGLAGYNYSMTQGDFSFLQSFLLRDNLFAVDGLVVDMSTDNPGIGFWNHTFPAAHKRGGATWSEDLLWLEPSTSCVNTNISLDYVLGKDQFQLDVKYNLTDRGGLVNLTREYPQYSREGQEIDLYAHVYKAAAVHNALLNQTLGNVTREQTYVGRGFPLNDTFARYGNTAFITTTNFLNQSRTSISTSTVDILCQGWGGGDNANISNVAVGCGMFLGPPRRTDGGNPLLLEKDSPWTQSIHICASVTKAKIQTTTFTFNGTGTPGLGDLQITRKDTTDSTLWGVEKTTLNISDIDILWGRITDKYENDTSLWTLRRNLLYVPAGAGDYWGLSVSGLPITMTGVSWHKIFTSLGTNMDIYMGINNFAVAVKWRTLIERDEDAGPAQITNLAWTNLVANNLMGNDTRTTLRASQLVPSLAYKYAYAIPAFILLLLWFPALIATLLLFVTGQVPPSLIRTLLQQTAVGRVVLGHSTLTPLARVEGLVPPRAGKVAMAGDLSTAGWEKTVGQTPVGFFQGDGLGQYTAAEKDDPSSSSHHA